jgi:hypothetical protein
VVNRNGLYLCRFKILNETIKYYLTILYICGIDESMKDITMENSLKDLLEEKEKSSEVKYVLRDLRFVMPVFGCRAEEGKEYMCVKAMLGSNGKCGFQTDIKTCLYLGL